MNECYFFLHILVICFFTLGALRLGKEALIAFFCLLTLIANLLVLKQIELCTLTITCTDPYVIGCFFTLGLLQYYYGHSIAQKALYLSLILLVFAVIVFEIHLRYIPIHEDSYHLLYHRLLRTITPMILFSLAIGFVSQKLTIFLQSFLRKLFPYSTNILHQTLVIACPIALVQLFDTMTFSLLAFRHIAYHLLHIIFMSYLIKIITLICMTPFISLSKKFYHSPNV